MSLIEETKAAMGYIDKPVKCVDCTYFEEQDHPVLDREWIKVCSYSNLCKFQVTESGQCKKYEPRAAQK
ncbi:MAG: hypothetical protein ACT4NV_03220 [Rhodoferax sp.]